MSIKELISDTLTGSGNRDRSESELVVVFKIEVCMELISAI